MSVLELKYFDWPIAGERCRVFCCISGNQCLTGDGQWLCPLKGGTPRYYALLGAFLLDLGGRLQGAVNNDVEFFVCSIARLFGVPLVHISFSSLLPSATTDVRLISTLRRRNEAHMAQFAQARNATFLSTQIFSPLHVPAHRPENSVGLLHLFHCPCLLPATLR